MPQAIAYAASSIGGAIAAGAEALGASLATTATIANVTTAVASAALTIGVNAALTQVLSPHPKMPTPESVAVPYNDSKPRKRWGTGRLRVSGPALYWDNSPGWSQEVRAVHNGPIDGFEQFYLHDDRVTVKGNSYVASFPAGSTNQRYAENLIAIYPRLGLTTETATSALVSASGGKWTSAHRANGVACIDMQFKAIVAKDQPRVYPHGEPQVSAVARLTKVFDWRDGTQTLNNPASWKWTDNAVVCHLFYEWFGRYLERPHLDYVYPNDRQLEVWSREFQPGLASWTTAANVCDEMVDLKAGGTEKRYRSAVMVISGADPADVRRTYLDAYDGKMFRTRDGVWKVVAGKYTAPTVTFADFDILNIRWGRGKSQGERYNIIEGGFLSPDNDYTTQRIFPWTDDLSIAAYGENRLPWDLTQVPSHAQARRLYKRKALQLAAIYEGEVVLRLKSGLSILDDAHRFIRIETSKGPNSLRDVILEVTDAIRVDFSTLSVTVPVRSVNTNIDVWVPELEEGFGPNETVRATNIVLDPPTIISVVEETQGSAGSRLAVKIPAPPNALYEYSVSWKKSTASSWTDGDFGGFETVTGGVLVRSLIVGGGATYNVRVRTRLINHLSDWSATSDVAVTVPTATYADLVDINSLRPAQIGADKTADHSAATIAGRGDLALLNAADWATQVGGRPGNLAGLTGLEAILNALRGNTDCVFPDPDLRDPAFWNAPSGVSFADSDGGWKQRRQIVFANGTYDFFSDLFPVDIGASYRVQARIWNNGGSFGGYFNAMIHMPAVAWFSLKHGTGVNPDVVNSSNFIVAGGDTLELDWIVKNPVGITDNVNRNWQFRFKGAFSGGPVVVTIVITRVSALGNMMLLQDGLTLAYDADLLTSVGSAATIAGRGDLALQNYVYFGSSFLKEGLGGSTATLAAFRTADGVAASFVGKTDWATFTRPLEYLTGANANLLYNGGLKLKSDGFGVDAGWAWVSGSAEGPFFNTTNGGTKAFYSQKPIAVYPSNTYTLQADMYAVGMTAGSLAVDVEWYTGAGVYISTSSRATAVNGTFWDDYSVTVTAPSTAARAIVRGFTESATNTNAAIRRIKFAGASVASLFTDEATNSALYGDGAHIDGLRPAEIGSDQTGSHSAATIAGRGDLALLNSVSLADGTVTNKSATYISYSTSATVESLRPAESGSDVTGSHSAATIAGRGDLALLNSVSLADGTVTNKTAVYIAYSTSVSVESLRPAEAGADPTGSHSAATFAGKGDLATLNFVAAIHIETSAVIADKLGNNAVGSGTVANGATTNGTGSMVTLITQSVTLPEYGLLKFNFNCFLTSGSSSTYSYAFNIYVNGVAVRYPSGTNIYTNNINIPYAEFVAAGTYTIQVDYSGGAGGGPVGPLICATPQLIIEYLNKLS